MSYQNDLANLIIATLVVFITLRWRDVFETTFKRYVKNSRWGPLIWSIILTLFVVLIIYLVRKFLLPPVTPEQLEQQTLNQAGIAVLASADEQFEPVGPRGTGPNESKKS